MAKSNSAKNGKQNSLNATRILSLYWLLLVATPCLSDITETTPLDFGRFAVVGAVASSLEVPWTGSTPKASGNLYVIDQANPGVFALSNYPANYPLIITVNDFVLTRGAGKVFWVTTFTHNNVITDSNGDATLRLGATLSTDGDSSGYFDTIYSGTMNLTVSY